jgi:hypothetical protein
MTAGVNSKENALDIIRRNTEGHPKPTLTPSENSKRAEKRVGSFLLSLFLIKIKLTISESKGSGPPGQTSEAEGQAES